MVASQPMPAIPHISIIVVCKNPGARLHRALESVWSQTAPDVELIVIDGASSDGTSEWLETQCFRISTLTSERDGGLYEAMNKGVSAARGKWLLFLGADDRLATPATLADALTTLNVTAAAIVVGEARFDDGRLYGFAGKSAAIRRNFLHHQATFYRREVYSRHGDFDTTLRIQADYEHNLRLLRSGEAFSTLPLRIAECASGGLSDSGLWANYREEITARHRHYPAWRCWPWDLLAVLRYVRKKLVLRQRRKT